MVILEITYKILKRLTTEINDPAELKSINQAIEEIELFRKGFENITADKIEQIKLILKT